MTLKLVLLASLALGPSTAKAAEDYYKSLLPVGAIERPSPSKDFNTTIVTPTIQSCYDELVKRRMEIWKAREGDADLSFNGELKLTATFEQGRLIAVRSQSHEVRDDKFHNCIENGMKNWSFPTEITKRPAWTYVKPISFDVNFTFPCKDGHFGGIIAKKCL